MPKDIKDNLEYQQLKKMIRELPQESLDKFEVFMEEKTKERPVYDVLQFAELTGLKATRVRRWLRTGAIKGQNVNGRWLIPHAELDRILKGVDPAA